MNILANFKSISFITILFLFLFISCSDKKSKPKKEADVTAIYKVETLSNHEYTFNGKDLIKAENPNLTLKRGETYLFKLETFGHPFYIKTEQVVGTEKAYNKGVVKNGIEFGDLLFTVSKDAPDTLFYICKFHKMMTGKLIIVD